MAGKKVGSDGQIRKTTTEWEADTATYPEGMRLMDTDTGAVRVSKGTTYALAWQAASGGAATWGTITGTLSDQTDLVSALASDDSPTATFSTNTNTAQDPGQDTFRFNNATIGSVTEIALSDVVGGVDKGDLNSRFTGILQFREVGTTTTVEFQITSAVHTTWTRYTVTYLKGTLPANGTVCAVRFLPGPVPKRYKWIGDGGAATGTVIANTLGVTINVTNPSTGTYVFTAASGTPFTTNKTTIYVQSLDGGTAYITGADNPSSSTSIQEVHTYDIAGALDNSPRYQVIIEVEP